MSTESFQHTSNPMDTPRHSRTLRAVGISVAALTFGAVAYDIHRDGLLQGGSGVSVTPYLGEPVDEGCAVENLLNQLPSEAALSSQKKLGHSFDHRDVSQGIVDLPAGTAEALVCLE